MIEATGLVVPLALSPGAPLASLNIVQMIQVMIIICGRWCFIFLKKYDVQNFNYLYLYDF